jgi:hypothetical protein
LEAILAEKPEDTAQNGEVFDRDTYLRQEEGFEDVEVVVSGRNSVKIDRKTVSGLHKQLSSPMKRISC